MKKILFIALLFLAVGSYCQDFDPVTGIEDDYELVEFRVYPNPVTDFITVVVDVREKEFTLFFFTMDGKIISEMQITHERTVFNLSMINKGLYMLAIYSKDKKQANLVRILKL